ncbi:MAG TPA: phosphotransferase [Kineosporiaceae bacterium]|nr:phosphotransferase [Kineosporiaceae bacterium]
MVIASGARIHWIDLPDAVRAAVEGILGSPVIEARSQPGGFSPGTADRVLTADGKRAFVKAVSSEQNDRSPQMHRREAEVAAAMPRSAPVPALLGSYDDGHWVALVFEDVNGRHPRTPWQSGELRQVLEALEKLAASTTPVPFDGLQPLADAVAEDFGGWARLRADPPADLNPWAAVRLDDLVAGAERGLTALAGDTLVHLDVRADNLLLTSDDTFPDGGTTPGVDHDVSSSRNSVAVVDWPHAARGPAWFDRVLLLINVRLYGGHDTTALLTELAARTRADPEDLVAVLVGWAGFFADTARLPALSGLPTLRAFQHAQAEAVLSWLAEVDLPG